MKFLLRLVTWWNSQTIGTQLYTWRKGQKVGEDDQGNVFYEDRNGVRRWVVYNGDIEASRVSPEWHGWLHHTFANPPSNEPLPKQTWELPHEMNLTGSNSAYVPPGSLRSGATQSRKEYIPWTPE